MQLGGVVHLHDLNTDRVNHRAYNAIHTIATPEEVSLEDGETGTEGPEIGKYVAVGPDRSGRAESDSLAETIKQSLLGAYTRATVEVAGAHVVAAPPNQHRSPASSLEQLVEQEVLEQRVDGCADGNFDGWLVGCRMGNLEG